VEASYNKFMPQPHQRLPISGYYMLYASRTSYRRLHIKLYELKSSRTKGILSSLIARTLLIFK